MSELILLVDDVRSFRDGRTCLPLRNTTAALTALADHHDDTIAELWLDHDLGTDAVTGRDLTVMPVIDELAAVRYRIGRVFIHTANPAGAVAMTRALTAAGYPIQRWRDNRTWINRRAEEGPR